MPLYSPLKTEILIDVFEPLTPVINYTLPDLSAYSRVRVEMHIVPESVAAPTIIFNGDAGPSYDWLEVNNYGKFGSANATRAATAVAANTTAVQAYALPGIGVLDRITTLLDGPIVISAGLLLVRAVATGSDTANLTFANLTGAPINSPASITLNWTIEANIPGGDMLLIQDDTSALIGAGFSAGATVDYELTFFTPPGLNHTVHSIGTELYNPTGQYEVHEYRGLWKNTDRITSAVIDCYFATNNFAVGTRFNVFATK